ncbi:Transforming growth factor-beta-induced like protein [Argiope bruennichi]|uniref:Transforming growth factor-beta-induced like protein n=1 Tax=Argiope bruennichi TaxID=94029 RepID=A0A8T0E273_ARGBR|nr:Transforming growth factor-beta-induced like protein [Argiope bruennichi]
MHEMLMKTSLTPKLLSGTFTLFSPTEEAFAALNPEVREKLMQNSTLLTKVLLNHIVPGTHYSAVLAHGYAMRSLGGEPIHITNRRGLILVNGIPIVRTDISVTNGVIHAINRLLLPPELYTRRRPATMAPPPRTDPIPAPPPFVKEYIPVPVYVEPPPPVPRTLTKTLATPLQLPDGSQMTFSTANSLLRRSLLLSTLKNNGSDTGYTMLVPTDAAYAALGPTGLDQLRRNSKLLRRMLLCQMVEGRLNLSSSGEDKDRPIRSLGGTIIVSSFNGGNSLTVGGARVLSVRQAADGLVLVTDKVTFPPPSRTVVDALSPFPKLTDFVKNRIQVQDSLATDGSVYTIFAPTDKALSVLSPSQLTDKNFISALQSSGCTLFLPTNHGLNNMSPTLRSITVGDPQRLRKFIRFHISPQVLSWNSVYDNSFMPTLLPSKRIRCNIYAKGRMPGSLTVSGCRVTAIRPLSPQSNVTIAVINEPMAPPVGDLPLTIAKTPMLKNFTKILKVSGLDNVLTDEGPYTLFAPNACAFADMDSEEYQRLITNRKLAIEFVKRYLVKGCYYTNGLQDGQTLLTEANTYLIVQVTPDCIIISGSKVLYGDMSTTNGVLHVIASLVTS